MTRSTLDRRVFLHLSAAAGAGLILGVPLRSSSVARDGEPAQFSPNAFVQIGADGAITVWIARQEMGQGVRTSLAMIVAEELDADWSLVGVRQAPFDAKYGPQGTGGSLSIRKTWEPLRRAGATARAMLVAAAAMTWELPANEISTRSGRVLHAASGRSLPFGDLAAAAAKLPVPTSVRLKDPSQFEIVGRARPLVDGPDIVTGRAVYGADIVLPGMLYASIERCPVIGGTLKSLDAAAALKLAGVRAVFPIDGRSHGWMLQWCHGVAVVADSTWAALKGREALRIEWDGGANARLDQEAILSELRALATRKGTVGRGVGDADSIIARAPRVIERDYLAPYLSHSPMETMNAVARVRPGSCEVWAPCQFPNIAHAIARNVTGLPEASVEVRTTLLGGGFGRRIYADYVGEAVIVSQRMAAPVQLLWTRSDDIRHGFYRPLSHHRMSAVIDGKGGIRAWRHRISGPSRDAVSGPDEPTPERSEIYAANELPYAIPNLQVEFNHHYVPLPCGPWRAVAYSQTGFVVESFVDELAIASGADPVAFRTRLLAARPPFEAGETRVDPPRMRRVLDLAAERSEWGRARLPEGVGRGVAVTADHGSCVAHVAEVSVDPDRRVRVQRIVSAVDCGTVVHPGGVAAQVEGAIAFALSAVLKSEITLRNGRVEQSGFTDCDVIRIDEMPRVEVHVLPSTAPPGGMGEPPLPGVAAAVLNAIHDAIGTRVRRIPIRPQDLEAQSAPGGRA